MSKNHKSKAKNMNTMKGIKEYCDKNLDPCPFCHSDQVRIIEGFGSSGKQCMVICGNCGITAAFDDAKTYIEVMERWNKRRRK